MLENLVLVEEKLQDDNYGYYNGYYAKPLTLKVWEFDYNGDHYEFRMNEKSYGDYGIRYTKSLFLITHDGSLKKEVAYLYANEVDEEDEENNPICRGTFEPSELTGALIDASLLDCDELYFCEYFDSFSFEAFIKFMKFMERTGGR